MNSVSRGWRIGVYEDSTERYDRREDDGTETTKNGEELMEIEARHEGLSPDEEEEAKHSVCLLKRRLSGVRHWVQPSCPS